MKQEIKLKFIQRRVKSKVLEKSCLGKRGVGETGSVVKSTIFSFRGLRFNSQHL